VQFTNSFLFKSYHPRPWRDLILQPIAPQAETIPLDHGARPSICQFVA
jgi:hypothetical protein